MKGYIIVIPIFILCNLILGISGIYLYINRDQFCDIKSLNLSLFSFIISIVSVFNVIIFLFYYKFNHTYILYMIYNFEFLLFFLSLFIVKDGISYCGLKGFLAYFISYDIYYIIQYGLLMYISLVDTNDICN